MMTIEVIWVDEDGRATRETVLVAEGASLRDVGARLTSLSAAWGQAAGFSVFGHLRDLDAPVGRGDRIEILAPLLADPKEARRQRVNSVRQARAKAGAFDRWTRAR
ncbi:MAG: RnfH family Ubiquitin [Pseudomonadota bacterium]|jgi:putative ubiquitin-RnfH superfamily antitoxin RatB of RatAB toxin-antitoxin module